MSLAIVFFVLLKFNRFEIRFMVYEKRSFEARKLFIDFDFCLSILILPIFLPARSKVASATSAMKSVFLQEVQQQDR